MERFDRVQLIAPRAALAVAVGSALTLALACGDDPTSRGGAPPDDAGASSGFQGGSSSGADPDGAAECVAKEADATPAKRPIDIVFVIDNSESMTEEIAEVEAQINDNFVSVIGPSGVDYRVIMLSRHGANADQRVCVKAPLSATACSPVPATPAESARFFHHNVNIASTDAWCKLLTTYSGPDLDGAHPQGWGSLLRPSSFRVFAVITDDHVTTSCNGLIFDDSSVDPVSGTNAANAFDGALRALSPAFGTAAKRRYVWHSIIGLAPFDGADLAKPHPSTSPIVTDKCAPGSESPGTGYQALSKLTGGLRYPTCGLDYTTIFQAMAKEVVDTAIVACEMPVPPAPAGETIDLDKTVVRFTPGAGAPVDFSRVANEAACAPGRYYVEDQIIKLCPAACDLVQGDPGATLKVLFGCAPRTN